MPESELSRLRRKLELSQIRVIQSSYALQQYKKGRFRISATDGPAPHAGIAEAVCRYTGQSPAAYHAPANASDAPKQSVGPIV